MTPEGLVKQEILRSLSVSKTKPSRWPRLRLFSNPSGGGWFQNNNGPKRYVRYGLGCSNVLKTADFIGWRLVEITQEMVGQNIAQFVSVEVKGKDGTIKPEQAAWYNLVNAQGGLGAIVRDAEGLDEFLDSVRNSL